VSNYALDLIERDLALPSTSEWLARLELREPVPLDTASLIGMDRKQREAELANR
jgi:hypothetical protein